MNIFRNSTIHYMMKIHSADQFKEISFSKSIVEQKFSNLFSNSFDTGSMNFDKDSFEKRDQRNFKLLNLLNCKQKLQGVQTESHFQ